MNVVQNQTETTAPKKFQFVGGELCLDFCNSVGGKRGLRSREYLNSYQDFVSWSEQAALLDPRRAHKLLQRAAHRPSTGTAALSAPSGCVRPFTGSFFLWDRIKSRQRTTSEN